MAIPIEAMGEDPPSFDTPIAAAAKRVIRIIDTGYLPDNFRRDLEVLMRGALAYEVVTGQHKPAVTTQERGEKE